MKIIIHVNGHTCNLHRYVPTIVTEEKVDVGEGKKLSIPIYYFHNILLGGDQLTCARIRGVQGLRQNSKSGARSDGFVPMIEDWHAGVCFMQV